MPIYEYKCAGCGKGFTLTMGIKEHDAAKITCPKCSSKQVVQRVSLFGVKTSKKS